MGWLWHGLAMLFVVTMPFAASAQELPESSFLVKVKYTKVDLPRSTSSTCLAVFPDGRFHMEQLSEWPSSGPRIFEESLPDESLKSLSRTLETQELKELRTVESGAIKIAQGGIVWAVIPRGETTQKLIFTAVEASGGQPPKPFPASLVPLVQWVQATTKALNQQKMKPLKNSKSVNCWLAAHQ
jgi:hypothetical protein